MRHRTLGTYIEINADNAWTWEIKFARRWALVSLRHPERIEIGEIRVVEVKEAA